MVFRRILSILWIKWNIDMRSLQCKRLSEFQNGFCCRTAVCTWHDKIRALCNQVIGNDSFVVHVFRALHTNEYWMKNRFILHLVWANILMDCFHIHHSHNHSSPLSLVTEENYEYNHFDHFQLSEFLIGVIYHIFTCDGIDVCVCAIYHTKSPKILISRVLNWKYRFIRKYAFVSKIFPTGSEEVPFQFSMMLHHPFRVLWCCWPLIRLAQVPSHY